MRRAAALVSAAVLAPAAHAQPVGTSFPPGFPVPVDHSLGVPVIGFGAEGPVERVPVVFLHGNNDTPYPTSCNSAFGEIHDFAESFRRRGYARSELWGLGYQGAQCDLQTEPTNKSGEAHSTVANVPDLRRFVHAVLAYTGATRVDIVGHSLGTTLAREWMRQDGAHRLVRTLVAVDGPNHGITNCSPSPANYFAADAAGGFNPDSAICLEYGSPRTPLLSRLNAGDETPGPTRYVTIYNADVSFVFFATRDGVFPASPAEDREGNPHDFGASPKLDGAEEHPLTGQGKYDAELQTAHLGIVASPQTWRIAHSALSPQAAEAGTRAPAPATAEPYDATRLTLRVRRQGRRLVLSGRLLAPRCGGTVGLQIRDRRRTVSARLARVRPNCAYRIAIRFGRPPRRPRVRARFFGTRTLAPSVADSRA